MQNRHSRWGAHDQIREWSAGPTVSRAHVQADCNGGHHRNFCGCRGRASGGLSAVRRNGCGRCRPWRGGEIEFQPLGAAHAGGTTKGLTDAIFNHGFADRWELVLQTTPQLTPEGFGPISVANAASLKYVVQPGVLQDKSGPSIATEFGALLPEFGGSGLGASWSGIVSQRPGRWAPGKRVSVWD